MTMDDEFQFEREFRLIKADAVRRVIEGVVLVADSPDAQRDEFPAAIVQKAAQKYLKESRLFDHNHRNTNDAIDIVESWLTKENSAAGPKGTWKVSAEVKDKTIWDQIEAGMLKAFSVFGRYRKIIGPERNIVTFAQVDRISLVPAGANGREFTLWKSADVKECAKVQSLEELIKSLPEDQAALIKARIKTAEGERDEALKKAADLESEKAVAALLKKCTFEKLTIKAEELAGLLIKVDPKVADSILTVLAAADTQVKESDLFKAAGSGREGAPSSEVMTKIDKLADELMQKDGKLTHEQAVCAVIEANPGLYAEYQKERES